MKNLYNQFLFRYCYHYSMLDSSGQQYEQVFQDEPNPNRAGSRKYKHLFADEYLPNMGLLKETDSHINVTELGRFQHQPVI